MKEKNQKRIGQVSRSVLAAAMMFIVLPADAIDLSKGDFTLNLDTTLSWGVRSRVSDRDLSIVGLANGGTAYSVNGDDGNLNFDKGIASNALKATIELDWAYKRRFGIFVRASGFYDYEIMNQDRARTPLGDAAQKRVGDPSEFLDYYAWLQFRIGNAPGEIRVGSQVLNWGESTFIQGGINIINPIDVASIRVPGAELREALLPQGMVYANISVSNAITLEGFYQYEWRQVRIDPTGAYFSTNDFAGEDGNFVLLGFGDVPDYDNPFFFQPTVDRPLLGVPRAPDRPAEDEGQYGAALRWFASGLGNTEFGFYYINYHSRLPTVNAITGTVAGALGAPQAGAEAAGRVYAAAGVPPGQDPTVDAMAAAAGAAVGQDSYTSTARYFISFPEDIKLYGLSWNTQLGTSGIAFQGEVAYRQDAPYLVDDVELLFAALSPISEGLALLNQVVPGGAGFEEEIAGTRRLDSTQLQFTMTKVFGPGLGADQSVLLLEAAWDWVPDLPDQDELRFEGPGTYVSGNPIMSLPGGAHAGKPAETPEHFASPNSWGYRLVGRLDYLNAIGAWNVVPRFAWRQDVSGITPGPAGNFLEGNKVITVGVNFNFQSKWFADLSYTDYFGASRYNLLNDRDFVAANIKFLF